VIPRRIVAVREQSEGVGVIDLDCGHSRHVRDRPPQESFPWIRDEDERRARIGTTIECGSCDALVRPKQMKRYRKGPSWNATTIPAGLFKRHELAVGVWGELTIVSGRIRLRYFAPLERELELGVGTVGTLAPEIPHELELLGDVLLRLDFYR